MLYKPISPNSLQKWKVSKNFVVCRVPSVFPQRASKPHFDTEWKNLPLPKL